MHACKPLHAAQNRQNPQQKTAYAAVCDRHWFEDSIISLQVTTSFNTLMNSRWTCFTKTKPIRALTHRSMQIATRSGLHLFSVSLVSTDEAAEKAEIMLWKWTDTNTHTHLYCWVCVWGMRWHAVLLEAEVDSIPSPKISIFLHHQIACFSFV